VSLVLAPVFFSVPVFLASLFFQRSLFKVKSQKSKVKIGGILQFQVLILRAIKKIDNCPEVNQCDPKTNFDF
jgi:peptidoglycan biosynthesis protein MviN/MurJ (putative lipid II flippase)